MGRAAPRGALSASPASLVFPRRSFHSSASLLIVGRSRSKKLVERAEAAAQAEAEAEREARTGSKLKALLRARAAEEEAAAAAALAEQYRKPKAKRRGKAFEARQELLAQADAEASEAALEAEEREAAEAEERAEREAARAAREGGRAAKRPMFPIDFNRPADAPLEPNPAPLVSNVQAQLRALESAPALRGNIGGLGFDTIDLSSRDVVESEVFESVQRSGGMRRLSEDKDRRSQYKRVERVTERSREIIGRVLLEESMRISDSQQVWQAQLDAHREAAALAVKSQAPQPKKPKSPPAAQLMDLRRTPSFVIHDLRYSTDLAWLQVRWTLGREPFPEQQPAAIAAAAAEAKSKRLSKRATAEAAAAAESAAVAASAASPSAPVPWSEAKRLIDNTLERATKTVRFALGRELDLRYTPNVRFVYDEAADARKQREKKQEAELAKDTKLIEAIARELEGNTDSGSGSGPNSVSSLASAKSSLLGLSGPADLELELASEFDAASVAADRQMERQYDEDRKWYLPKRKQVALAEKKKRKEKRFEETRRRKELLAHARQQAHGAPTKGVATLESDPFKALDPSTGTNPVAMRAQLKATMAALLKVAKPNDTANLKQLRDTRSSLGMLNQIQALQKKADINPIEELKKKMRRESTPQYPKNWRTLSQQYYKK